MRDRKFIKYVYNDAYKAPEAVTSILREEGLTEKQVARCMRKRNKYLDKLKNRANRWEVGMCKHGEYAIMNLEVEVDRCLAPLIKALHKYGIKTRACCCGHDEKIGSKKVNNHIILSATGVEFGMKNEDGISKGWQKASDFNVWGISFPIIENRGKE